MNDKSFYHKKKYNMMRDFDILAINKKQQKELYQKANYEKGLQMMSQKYIRNQNGQKYSIFVSIEQFKKYGPGIYLLFLFLKYSTILLFILSIISFINLGVLTSGGEFSKKQNSFQISFTRTTLANVQEKQLGVVIAFDYILTVIVLVSLIIWQQKQLTYVVECCQQMMLPSYQTIILKEIPQDYTQHSMKMFLQQRFGQIQDIYTVRDFHNDLYHYKQISKIITKYKQQRALIKIQPQKGSLQLAKLFFKYEQYYNFILQRDKLYKYPKQFAFITFKSVKSRQQIIKFYKKTFKQLPNDKKQYYLFKNQQLEIKACLMQPNGIKWQNLNIPKKNKIMWLIIQIFLLIIVLVLSISVIFILFSIENSLSLSQYHGMSKEAILKINKNQALQSYCLGLSLIKFNSDQDCQLFYSSYLEYNIYFIALPLTISIFKFLLTEVMKFLVNLRRHPYTIYQIQSQIIIMFVFYFFATGLLQYFVFLQINFQDGSKFSLFYILNPIHKLLFSDFYKDTFKIDISNDYNKNWYLIASQKIILISIASFNISSLGIIAYSVARKFLTVFYAKKQILQCRMNIWLEGQQLQIQFIYAFVLTLIYFIFLFGASIPVIYPFTCISLFVLFWTVKLVFIKFCAKPLLYSHNMNSLIVKILLCGIIMHCIVSPIYFGAETIYSNQGISYFLRVPYFGYYIIIIVICLLYLIYREKLLYLLDKFKSIYQQDVQSNKEELTRSKLKGISLPSKLCLIQPRLIKQKNKNLSYSMHRNPDYELILKTLYTINTQQRLRVSCILNKQLQNLLENNDNLIQVDQNIDSQTYLFHQLLKLTQTNLMKFQKTVGKNVSQSKNPYYHYFQQLKQIKRISSQTQNQIIKGILSLCFRSNTLKNFDITMFKSMANSQQNNNIQQHHKNLQNLKKKLQKDTNIVQAIVQKSDQQSLSHDTVRNRTDQQQYQENPGTQVRLRYQQNFRNQRQFVPISNLQINKIKTQRKFQTQSTILPLSNSKINKLNISHAQFNPIIQQKQIIDMEYSLPNLPNLLQKETAHFQDNNYISNQNPISPPSIIKKQKNNQKQIVSKKSKIIRQYLINKLPKLQFYSLKQISFKDNNQNMDKNLNISEKSKYQNKQLQI